MQGVQSGQSREVFQFGNVIVAEIDGVESVAGDGEVFDGGYGEGAEYQFSFAEGVGPLFGGLDYFGRETHDYFYVVSR